MKKSLLLIDLLFLMFLVVSCRNTANYKPESTIETKQIITNPAIASDTAKVQNQTSVSGTKDAGQGIIKDTNSGNINAQPIIHHSPNDAKIDSIKNAKAKLKK